MQKDSKIYVAGHRGLVGSAIVRALERNGYTNIIGRTHGELDLTRQADVEAFFASERPEYVFLAAAKVGGIMANSIYRADFITENLQIALNVVTAAYKSGVEKLLFLGSSCIYPREAPQPMTEEALLTGPLEYTNEPYALAKIAGMRLCEAFNAQYGTNYLAVMPTNLYGPNDNYNLVGSHVLPAMLRKMHLAKLLRSGDLGGIRADLARRATGEATEGLDDEGLLSFLGRHGITQHGGEVELTLWGTGRPLREFLHSDDMAEACVFVMERVEWRDLVGLARDGEVRNLHLNVGSGRELTIGALAELVRSVVGFEGLVSFDASKPDGTPRKLMDNSRLMGMGWKPRVELREGVERVYREYCG